MEKNKKFALILLIVGFIIILVNAIDYLAGWSYLPEWLFLIGLLLVVFGQIINGVKK